MMMRWGRVAGRSFVLSLIGFICLIGSLWTTTLLADDAAAEADGAVAAFAEECKKATTAEAERDAIDEVFRTLAVEDAEVAVAAEDHLDPGCGRHHRRSTQ